MNDFKDILEFSSTHNGIITAFATLVIAISTICIVWLTRIVVKDNRIWRKASTEPAVTAYIHTHDGFHAAWYYFSVANLGNGPATNVEVSIGNGDKEAFDRCSVEIPHDYKAKYSALPAGAKRTYVFSKHTDIFGFKEPYLKEYRDLETSCEELEQRARELETEYRESGTEDQRETIKREAVLLNQKLTHIEQDMNDKRIAVLALEKKKRKEMDIGDRLAPLHVNIEYDRPDGRRVSRIHVLDVGDNPPSAQPAQAPEQFLSRNVEALHQSIMVLAAMEAAKLSPTARRNLEQAFDNNKLETAKGVMQMANLVTFEE